MLTYHPINSGSPTELLSLLNDPQVRKHLLDHPAFSPDSVSAWLADKIKEDEKPGCRIRLIRNDGQVAGWCGIQHYDGQFELAIVLAPSEWGCGKMVFETVKEWAKQEGHASLAIHFPETRPQRRAIARLLGHPVSETYIQGTRFLTYSITI